MFWIVVIVAIVAFVLYKRAKGSDNSPTRPNTTQNRSTSTKQPSTNYFEALDKREEERAQREAEEKEEIPEDADCDECFEKGVAYYKNGNIRQALKYFTFVAEKENNCSAQYNVGIIYRDGGKGVVKDPKKAVEWFRKAAEQGYSDAQDELGKCYARGNGVPKDMTKATEWFAKSVEQGNIEGKNDLAKCYLTGDGIAKDERKAVALWQSIAEQNHIDAQFFLGLAYSNKDSDLYDMRKAAEWWEKAAEQGLSSAQARIGNCYLQGAGVPQDSVKAVQWLTKAAENDDIDAMTILGSYYVKQNTGEGVFESIKWFEKAANQGNFFAIQMAAQTNQIRALACMGVARAGITEGWADALAHWKKVHMWASKERDCIDAGQPNVKPEERDRAMQMIGESSYRMGICYWIMKQHVEAMRVLRDLRDTKARVLYGVCLFKQAKERNGYADAYEQLILIETDDRYSSAEKTLEEDAIYAIAAQYLSILYRLGLENKVRPDMNAAVAVLQKASASIQDEGYKQEVEAELKKYKKKMFGGYQYSE